ncbi:MAG: 30S ribosomal protein S3 [Candidatus Omnitrophica bacterium]|nr:30S ribosomal protein S3 [Candidatus Omnitrophota bacterium]
MGQKVHPYGLRLGYIKNWKSRWFSRAKDFAALLNEDIKIRTYIKKQYAAAAISCVEIERASDRVRVIINSARPGIIIGRRGQDIDRLRQDLSKMTNKDVYIDIKEIKDPQTDAQLIAENIAFQMEKRIGFRRAMKKSVQLAMEHGAEGVKIRCSGRLDGIELARSEVYKEGKVPLQTLRADIDYGFTEALTGYGLIGVKVWLYKGEVLLDKKLKAENRKPAVENKQQTTASKE